MNPYLKKYKNGGEGDPEDPIEIIKNWSLVPENKPMPGLGAQPYQQTPTYSYNWSNPKASTPTAVHLPSGAYNTPQQIEKKKKNEERKESFWNTVGAVDQAIGQYLIQPAFELVNTPFALFAEGVNAIQGKEASLERALPNPTRIALNAQGIQSDIPNQQLLSDYLGVDKNKNPYLALGLDILTPGPAMITKPIKALTGLDKATKGTIQYAPKTIAANAVNNGKSSIYSYSVADDVYTDLYGNKINPKQVQNFIEEEGLKIIKEGIETPEGRRRLALQLKKEDPKLTTSEIDDLVETRIAETKASVIHNLPRHFQEGIINRPYMNIAEEFEDTFPLNNAFWRGGNPAYPPSSASSNTSSGVIKLSRKVNPFANKDFRPGVITLGRGYTDDLATLDHEVGHATAKGGQMPIDRELMQLLKPKSIFDKGYEWLINKLIPETKDNYNYFSKSGGRTWKNEPYPFLREARRKMIQDGILKDTYDKVTPLKLFKHFMGNNASRIIDFTPPWKYSALAKKFNEAPALVPGIIGTGAAGIGANEMMQQAKEKFRTGGSVNPYLSYNNGGKVIVNGKEMSIDSDEYRRLYNTGNLMSVDKDGIPVRWINDEVVVTAKLTDEERQNIKKKRDQEAMYNTLQAGVQAGSFDGLDNQGNYIFVPDKNGGIDAAMRSALFEGIPELTGIPSLIRVLKDPMGHLNSALRTMDGISTLGTMPYDSYNTSEDVSKTFDVAGAAGTVLPFSKVLKPTSIKSVKVPSFNFNKGNYQNILDKGLDIHDVRLKYHNNEILDFDEIDMLNKYGKGTEKNYKNVDPTNLSDAFLDIYGKVSETKSDKVDFMKMFLGEDFDKINIPENIQNNIDAPKDIINLEQNIVKPKSPTWNIEDFVMGRYKGPYERTAESRLADKWLTEWYNNPTTKQRFLDYGGTEEGWTEVLNSLENPIRSGKPYPKSLDDIAGLYSPYLNKASINTNILQEELIPTGVHEGAHKTRIIDKNHILKKGPSGLKNLYNDITDASRLQPEETYSEIIRMRYMQGWKPETVVTMDMLEKGLKELGGGYMMSAKIKDKNKLLEIINKAPVVIPGILGTGAAATIGASQLNQQTPQNRYGGQNPYIMQKYKYGGPVDPVDPEEQLQKTKEYLLSMVNSPLLKERYAASKGKRIEDVTENELAEYKEKISQNINTAKMGDYYKIKPKYKAKETDGFYYPPYTRKEKESGLQDIIDMGKLVISEGGKITDKNVKNLLDFEDNYAHKFFITKNKYTPGTISHEYSHASTRANEDLDFKGEAGKYNINEERINKFPDLYKYYKDDEEYNIDPTEQKARIDAVRQWMRDNKIYDATKERFDENHYNLLRENYNNSPESLDESTKEQMMDLLFPYDKTELIRMFNTYTKNINNENNPYLNYSRFGTKMDLKTGDMYTYEKGGNAGHSTVEIERSERVYTPDGKLIMETPADAPTHEEGGVKVTLPAGSLVFPKKYYKALDAASGLPEFKKIAKTMLDNAEKAYLRGEPYSSGGKRQ